jgi:hypothetical protein
MIGERNRHDARTFLVSMIQVRWKDGQVDGKMGNMNTSSLQTWRSLVGEGQEGSVNVSSSDGLVSDVW